MVCGLAGGTIVAFAAFLLFGASETILHGTPRLVCGIIFGIGTLVLLFFTVWMGALHLAFDYNGKRKLSKTISMTGRSALSCSGHRCMRERTGLLSVSRM